jgi:hypothetical protein
MGQSERNEFKLNRHARAWRGHLSLFNGLNEAAVAALKLLQQWECKRHPRRWPARLE